MKHLKSLGLAVVAAMALTAFIGAGSASATVLCELTMTPCGSGNIYGAEPSEFAVSLPENTNTYFKEKSTVLDECTGSTLGGNVKDIGGASKPVVITISSLEFSGCSQTTWVIKSGATLNVNHIAGTDNGGIEGKGELTVKIKVGGKTECNFTLGPSMLSFGTFTGGKSALVDLKTTLWKVSRLEFLCPGEVTWEGQYTVSNPVNMTLHAQAQ